MIIFVAFSLLYILFLLWCRYHWMHIPQVNRSTSSSLTFSVVLPVRNEEANIADLIADLQRQNYPHSWFEVILVDDGSEDETIDLAQSAFAKTDLSFQILELSERKLTGKKQAITYGVESARNEIILCTDGDCRLPATWIEAYAQLYEASGCQMVAGPVRMKGETFFTNLQAVEFGGLIGIGAASLQSGNPGMCNGANLSYRKKIFQEVGGYEGNTQIASGDDEFLLQKIFARHSNAVRFLKSKDGIVTTPAKSTMGELVSQRLRWSSKWKFHKSWYIRVMAVLAFLNYVSVFIGALQGFLFENGVLVFGSIMILRWLTAYFFVLPVSQFSDIRKPLLYSFWVEIIYPFVVIFLGIASIFGQYSWKGRRYS